MHRCVIVDTQVCILRQALPYNNTPSRGGGGGEVYLEAERLSKFQYKHSDSLRKLARLFTGVQ